MLNVEIASFEFRISLVEMAVTYHAVRPHLDKLMLARSYCTFRVTAVNVEYWSLGVSSASLEHCSAIPTLFSECQVYSGRCVVSFGQFVTW